MQKLLVIHQLGFGGAERVASMLANFWAQRGERVGIIVMSNAQRPSYALSSSIELFYLDNVQASRGIASALAGNWSRLRSIRSLIRKLDPDYVIGVMTSANVLAILAGMGLRCRVIGTEHLHPPQAPLKPVWELARRRVYRYAAAVTAPTASTADWLATHTFAERVVVVGNPISVPLTVTDPVVATTDYLEPKRKLCLAVGRLTEQKGFDLLIRAFAGVGRTHPEWALVIVGEGDSRAELESLARELHLDDQVLFPGIVGNITDWYTRAQIFVMSSRFEGFGNTLAEAMAHGCACVSFDCEAGPASIIRGPGEGIFLPREDVDALAASLDRLMSDPMLCDQFRANGQLAIGRFAVNVIGSEWDDLLAGVADYRKAPLLLRWLRAATKLLYKAQGTGLPRVAECVRRLAARVSVRNMWGSDVWIDDFGGASRLACDLSDHMGSQIFFRGDYSGGQLRLLERLLESNSVFVDVGANHGEFTVFAAARLISGTVHAFEPVSTVRQRLESNVRANGLRNVRIHGVGLADAARDAVPIYGSSEVFGDGTRNTGLPTLYALSDRGQQMETISLVTLDRHLSGQESVDVIKIDVEGAELSVLRGAEGIIGRERPYILFEANAETCAAAGHGVRDIFAWLQERGYRLAQIDDQGATSALDTIPAFANVIAVPIKLASSKIDS